MNLDNLPKSYEAKYRLIRVKKWEVKFLLYMKILKKLLVPQKCSSEWIWKP